jgi:hypothetical protein
MFSKALGSWLYQIGAFAMVLITWALIPVRPAPSGFTLHKILCLCLVRTLNGAVKGIQVPLHLTWALIPVKPAAWCFYPTQNTMFTPDEDLKEGCFGYSHPTPPHMSPYSNKALWLGLYPTQTAMFTPGEDLEQGCLGNSGPTFGSCLVRGALAHRTAPYMSLTYT